MCRYQLPMQSYEADVPLFEPIRGCVGGFNLLSACHLSECAFIFAHPLYVCMVYMYLYPNDTNMYII